MMAGARETYPRIKGAVMRRLFVALALLASVSAASADEFEFPGTLRGSNAYVPAAPVFTRWSGYYVGGIVGYGNASMDFSNATRDLYAFMLRELALESEQHVSQWQVLGVGNSNSRSFGGFAGFNSQWDDVVVGIDVHYSATHFAASAPATPISRVVTAGGLPYDVTLNGNANLNVTSWGAARLRGGYIWNNIMPYGTVGVALGFADGSRTATATGEQNPPTPPATCAGSPTCVPFSFSATDTRRNMFMFGYTAGAGVDVLVLPNLFVRGEYEFAGFQTVMGTRTLINTVRGGAALKY